MKILITGCMGYVGKILINNLPKSYTKIGIDDLSNSNYEKLKVSNFKFYKLDFSNLKELDEIFNNYNIKYVIHLAASSSIFCKGDIILNNYKKTAKLIKYLNEKNIKNFIFASTAAVYGKEKKNKINLNINTPINEYGKSKLMVEKFINENKNKLNFNTTILRIFNIYGVDFKNKIKRTSNDNDLISSIVKNISKNKDILIFGDNFNSKDGFAERDFIHINDLVKIIKLLIKKPLPKNITLDIGTGKPHSTKDIINIFSKYLKKDISIKIKPKRNFELDSSVCNNKKLLDLLGRFNFKNIDLGIKEIIYLLKLE